MFISSLAIFLYALFTIGVGVAGFFLGLFRRDEISDQEVQTLLDELADLNMKLEARQDAERAAKFRQRTSSSDPNRQATIRKARVRAYRSNTPDPRK